MNPYAQQEESRFSDADPFAEPERTSLAAILGFICSLGGCCGGVTAILGVPLSIVGLVGIGRSRGRLGGKGFAVAGLVIGLLNLAVWGGCIGGGGYMFRMGLTRIGQPAGRALENMQADQFDAARANLVSPAADVSDAEMIAFREAYRSTLGDFQGLPDGAWDYLTGFGKLGPIAQNASGRQQVFPTPATFQSGPALILVGMDQGGAIVSLTVIDTQGNEYTLPMPPGWEDSQTAAPDPAEEEPENPDAPPDAPAGP